MAPAAEFPAVARLRMRPVIYVQVAAAVFAVVVGQSEVNPWLHWAAILIPLAPLAVAIAIASPILVSLDVIRNWSSGFAIVAALLSATLSALVFYVLLPLVQ